MSPRHSKGQAMAEFVVMVAGCILLLFVVVPFIAKMNDMAYKSQEAARYAAWERTVWYATRDDGDERNPRQIDTRSNFAARSDNEVLNSAGQRILSFSQEPTLLAIEDSTNTTINNNYWRWTQSGTKQSMLSADETMQDASSLEDQATPSLAYGIIDTYNSVMGAIVKVVSIFTLGGINDSGYLQVDHPTHNFYSSDVKIPVSLAGSNLGANPIVPDSISQLSVNARAAVLADGWIPQDEAHFDEKVDDFVLGTLIEDNSIWGAVRSIIGFFEPSFKDVDFSPVNTAPMPDSDVSCNATNGYCKF